MHLLFWHIEGVSYKLEVSAYLCEGMKKSL